MVEQTLEQKKFLEELLTICEHDGSFIQVGEVKRLILRAVELVLDQQAKQIFEELENLGCYSTKEECFVIWFNEFEKVMSKFVQEAEKNE